VARGGEERSGGILGGLLGVIVGVNDAPAESLVVPNAVASIEGNRNNAAPFHFASRYQQVFNAGEFSSLVGPVLITQILFRPDAIFGNAFSSTLPSIQISLSTTSAAADALSPVFASNIGADNAVVLTGPLLLSSAFTGPANGPKDFDILIALQNPFVYDWAKGNLLLDVKNFTTTRLYPCSTHTTLLAIPSRGFGMMSIQTPKWDFLRPEIPMISRIRLDSSPSLHSQSRARLYQSRVRSCSPYLALVRSACVLAQATRGDQVKIARWNKAKSPQSATHPGWFHSMNGL
jgi:hypothetical protein